MRLLEYTSAVTAASRVDRESGIIRDVLILGPDSANKRTYSPGALATAAKLYEGAPTFVDHAPGQRRSYRDKIGHLKNTRLADGGVRGDLHINPAHPAAPQLLWDAANNPSAVGLSHDAEGVVKTGPDGQVIVESIQSIRSVDLVAEPATTKSLYEDRNMPDSNDTTTATTDAAKPDPMEALYASLTLDDLKAKRADLLEMLRKEVQEAVTTPMQGLKTQLDELRAKLDEYTTAEAAEQQMTEAKLDPAKVPPRLRESICREKDKTKRAALIEDVQKLVANTSAQPVSVSSWHTPSSEGDLKTRLASWRG
jgi:hypothetical protein